MQETSSASFRQFIDATPNSATHTLTPAVWVTLAWFAAVIAAGAAGFFQAPGPPVRIGLAAGLPPLLAVGAALGSAHFRAWARSLDLRVLALLQTWRVGGLAFLALAAVHALPAGFALPAGYGDVAVGLSAPLVALYVVGRGATGRRLFVAWTLFGILDLLNAVALGVLHSDSPVGLLATDVNTDLMEQLPMVLIPAFGVPITLVLHVISLMTVSDPARRSRIELPR